MNRIQNLKMKNLKMDDIFSIFTEYVKDEIEKDISAIYEKEARRFSNPEDPWVFELKDR